MLKSCNVFLHVCVCNMRCVCRMNTWIVVMVREHELSVRHWCFALLNFVHLVIVSAFLSSETTASVNVCQLLSCY